MSTHILIMAPYYPPFVKGGGPIRSIYNLVNTLSTDYRFSVITGDRDLGDSVKGKSIRTDKWVDVEGARVLYAPATKLSPLRLARLLRQSHPDVIYCNSFFSYRYSILPVLLSRLRLTSGRLVLAPRGEFSPGALSLKNRKKRLFLGLSRAMRLHKSVTWHATTDAEADLVRAEMAAPVSIVVAPNLVDPPTQKPEALDREKSRGSLKIVFVSRITRKKNLKLALQCLEGIQGNIELDIYGPLEDLQYWRECEEIMHTLESRHQIKYRGTASHSDIPAIFRHAQILLFPTLGENFGHVIYEALANGCPVITSDQTPWIDLNARGAGQSLPLDDIGAFSDAVQRFVDMPQPEYLVASRQAHSYGIQVANESARDRGYHCLFDLGSND